MADSRSLTEAWQVIHSMLGDRLSHEVERKALGGTLVKWSLRYRSGTSEKRNLGHGTPWMVIPLLSVMVPQ